MTELEAIQSSISINSQPKSSKTLLSTSDMLFPSNQRSNCKAKDIGQRFNTEICCQKTYDKNYLSNMVQQTASNKILKNQPLEFCDLAPVNKYTSLDQSDSNEECQQDEQQITKCYQKMKSDYNTFDKKQNMANKYHIKNKIEKADSSLEVQKSLNKKKDVKIKQLLNFTYCNLPTAQSNNSRKKQLKNNISCESLLVKQISKNKQLSSQLQKAKKQNLFLRTIICDIHKKQIIPNFKQNKEKHQKLTKIKKGKKIESKIGNHKVSNKQQICKNIVNSKNHCNIEQNNKNSRKIINLQKRIEGIEEAMNKLIKKSPHKKNEVIQSSYTNNFLKTEPKIKKSFLNLL